MLPSTRSRLVDTIATGASGGKEKVYNSPLRMKGSSLLRGQDLIRESTRVPVGGKEKHGSLWQSSVPVMTLPSKVTDGLDAMSIVHCCLLGLTVVNSFSGADVL